MFERPRQGTHQVLGNFVFVLLAIFLMPCAWGAPLIFRISTENNASHFQTRTVQRFADDLARRTQGRLQVEFHPAAQLFRDQDVLRAINDGKVEMAVPGNWQLDRYDPYVSVLTLPVFFGLDESRHHQIRDGHLGRRISDHLQDSLNVVVPGRWLDLGYSHVFTTTRQVSSFTDMAGLRIRIAGGTAIAEQVTAVGAIPTVVAWPDLEAVMQQGRIDGLLTTFETAVSGALQEKGVRYCVEVNAYFAQYIPVISRGFWKALPKDLQRDIHASWESVVDSARAEAQGAQDAARKLLVQRGVQVVKLNRDEMTAWRKQASSSQSELAGKLNIPASLVAEAVKQAGAGK